MYEWLLLNAAGTKSLFPGGFLGISLHSACDSGACTCTHTHTRKEQDHQLLQMSVDKEAELEKGKLQSCCCCSNKLISS